LKRASASRLVGLVLLCAVLAPRGAAEAKAPGPRALLDRALRTTRGASAPFRQTRVDALGTTVMDGRLDYRKPRLLRLEWTGKVPATAIVNGDTVWFYQPRQKSVLKSSAAAGGAPPALFLEESVAVLEKSYKVRESGRATLVLEPRAERAPWSRMTLVLDPTTGWPTRLTLVARGGETTRLDFGRFRLGGGAPATRFAPRFPKDVSVVEL
jgi:outer membrane lipoprotein-sorting protein